MKYPDNLNVAGKPTRLIDPKYPFHQMKNFQILGRTERCTKAVTARILVNQTIKCRCGCKTTAFEQLGCPWQPARGKGEQTRHKTTHHKPLCVSELSSRLTFSRPEHQKTGRTGFTMLGIPDGTSDARSAGCQPMPAKPR